VNGVIRAKMRIQMGEDSSPTQREQNAGAFDAEFPCQTSCFFPKQPFYWQEGNGLYFIRPNSVSRNPTEISAD
jgi:hypothetical protein